MPLPQGAVQPWTHPSFIDAVANLQRDRQIRGSYQPDEVQFHDRCAVCTAALAVSLGHPFSPFLTTELERIQKEAIYQNRVFFTRNLVFVTPTEAWRISFEDALRFEKIHEETYGDFGFELVSVEPGSLAERVSFVKGWFQNTLPVFVNGFTPRSRLVIHNDSDLYSSTLFTLASLNVLLVPGAVVILDDFSMATHVFRAFADYRSAFMRSAHPVAMTSDYAAQVAFVFD